MSFQTQFLEEEKRLFSQRKNQNILNKQVKFCIHCGSPLEDEDVFCVECGEKIENDYEEESLKKSDEKKVAPKISSDRMASILSTKAHALSQISATDAEQVSNESKKIKEYFDSKEKQSQELREIITEKTPLKLGYYVFKDKEKILYLIINSITGTTVSASVKTICTSGSYGTENYIGTITGSHLTLDLCNSDVHPRPDEIHITSTSISRVSHTFLIGEKFSGSVLDDQISGHFSGEYSQDVVFIRQ